VSTPTEQRELVIAATEGSCPRCGAAREPGQDYCVECGLRLPVLTGTLPKLRRSWIRRLGWYPGDWVWASLLMLGVAVAGAAVAIVITHGERTAASRTSVAPTAPHVTVRPPTTTASSATTSATTTPVPTAPQNGDLTWPTGRNGWTIVLVSYPASVGQAAARQTAGKAVRAGLKQVGVLDSSSYVSLQPGYLVVFTGIYDTHDAAATAQASAQAAGFSGAYVRQVAR
jgi:hypothetical protein